MATGLRRPLAMTLRLPLLFLRGRYAELALAVVALTISVAAICTIDLVNRAILASFIEVIDRMAGRSALQVQAGEGGLFPVEVTEAVQEVAGVELAVPVVTTTAFVGDERGELLSVLGVDIADEPSVRLYEPAAVLASTPVDRRLGIDDPLVFLNQPDSIALTKVFAAEHGFELGEQVALDTPQGRRQFTVRGLLEPDGVARVFGGKLAIMDIVAAQTVFGKRGFVNRIDVVVRRDADVPTVSRDISAVLPSGIHVSTPEQRKADLHRIILSIQLILWAVGLIGLIMCFLIAFNRIATHFEARAWEASVLRAVGVRTGNVWWELLKEALLLGFVGVALGIPLGIGLGRIVLPLISMATAVNFKLLPSGTDLTISWQSILIAAAAGFSAAILAAALPAWRAAKVPIVAALRGRGISPRDSAGIAVWLFRGLLGVGVIVTLIGHMLSESIVWGLAATALIAVGTVFAARPLLRLLRRPLIPTLGMLAGPTGPFAWSAILGNPRRTGLTLGMAALGLGSVLWLITMAYSFERTLIYAQTGAVRAELVVTSANVASGWVAAPVDEALVAELATVPGVAGVAGNRLLEWPYGGSHVAINAYDPAYFTDQRFGRWLLLDESRPDAVWEAVARGEGVVVSTNFVQSFGARRDDRIVIETPTGPLSVRVLGITMDFAAAAGTVQLSRALYRDRWHDNQVNRAWVRTSPDMAVSDVQRAIARSLKDKYPLRFFASGEMVAYWVEQIRRGFAGVHVLRFLVLVTMLVGLADTLVAGVVQRVRQLGVVRAVGARRWHLERMVLVEGLVLGFLGLGLSAAMGLSLGALWIERTFPQLLGYVLDLYVPYWEIALLAAATILVSVASAVVPARRAAKLHPAAALRYE